MFKHSMHRAKPLAALCSAIALTTAAQAQAVVATHAKNGKVVFVGRDSGKKNDLYIMNSDGSGLRQLTSTAIGNEDTPTVSPDGKTIVYASDELSPGYYDLYSIKPDGTGKTLLNNAPRSQRTPDFSPDGKYIYYDSAEDNGTSTTIYREIYRMDADGKNRVNMTNTPGVSEDGPRVNPCDPTKIATTANTPSGRFDVLEFDTTTSKFTNLTNDARYHDRFLGYSPDCADIVYESTNGPSASWQINTMASDGTNKNQLTNSGQNRYPSYSPDGERIIFTGGAAIDALKVFSMKTDGTDKKQIPSGLAGTEERPVWGADLTPASPAGPASTL